MAEVVPHNEAGPDIVPGTAGCLPINLLRVQQTDICVNVRGDRQIKGEKCMENSTRWIYDNESELIVDLTLG